ncbi:GtrA family protein [Pseudomonas sp. LP_7_YM]|uniref:GtrA family protein n=1 Tax=Pseudomonas sp. LP_7_YM TaxID=2485137 RepID=UPI0010D0CD82|nr:GtrA family protein [Pseudomonas sp. LP_7_YM]TDV70125.1 putative flippase GtrA [Pseudomonas sp. LP_7_YM]
MTALHGFARYCLVGLFNTGLHGLVFFGLQRLWGLSQASSNLVGFLAAVSLSFVLNAHFTFHAHRSWRRYCAYCAFMGLVSLCVGALGDALAWPPIATLVVFTGMSLVLGFTFARQVVFGRSAQ